jgi:hypothetical protein
MHNLYLFTTYCWTNKGTILAIGGLIVTSGIKTLPIPGEKFKIYEWFYDWAHQFFNLPNNRLAHTEIPTPPIPQPLNENTNK